MLAWLCQQPDLEEDLKYLTVFISWVLGEQGFGGWFGLSLAHGSAKCGSERANWHWSIAWKETSLLMLLLSWASFFIAIQLWTSKGWNSSSEIACERLVAELLTGGLAWTYWILTTFLAASCRVNRHPSAVISPTQSIETPPADGNLHPPSSLQNKGSLQSEGNSKSSLERCHSWVLQQGCCLAQESYCACQYFSNCHWTVKSFFNRNATLRI